LSSYTKIICFKCFFRKKNDSDFHYYHDSTSALFFYDFLASETNMIGCKVQKDLRKFLGKYKNIIASVELLPNPVEIIIKTLMQ